MGANTGETLQERSKGKDVRTSNIVAAKVRSLGTGTATLAVSHLGGWTHCTPLDLSNFGQRGAWSGAVGRRCRLDGGWDRRSPSLPLQY